MSIQEGQVLRVVADLEKKRREMKISQRELASMSGLSHSGISEMESGKTSPTLHFLLLIATALEVDLGKIITSSYREEK